MADTFADAVNQEIIRRAAEEGQKNAVQQGHPGGHADPPGGDRRSRPRPTSSTSPRPIPTVVGYFGPAVLALILQHMAVTLIALSVVRDRISGAIELFRVSPVSAWEVVAGKILGFGVLCAAIAVVSLALLVAGLGVPMLGTFGLLAGVVALLVVASLGLGLLISIVSDSERQAVQLSLLVLLASVFFSGFAVPISEFTDAGAHGRLRHPGHERHHADAGRDASGRDPRAVAGRDPRGDRGRAAARVLAPPAAGA